MTNLKKAISVLLSISIIMSLFAFSGINAFADENDFKYSVVNGSAVITGYMDKNWPQDYVYLHPVKLSKWS